MKKNKKRKTFYLFWGVNSLILFILCLLAMLLHPLSAALSPISVDSPVLDEKQRNADYVIVRPETLYYTGFDYVKNTHVKGRYYYCLTEDSCTFFLLLPEGEEAPQTVERATITARVNEAEETLSDLTTSFARKISWSKDGLGSMTSPYVLEEVSFSRTRILVTFLSLALFTVTCLVTFLLNLLKYVKAR